MQVGLMALQGWKREYEVRPQSVSVSYEQFKYPVTEVQGSIKKSTSHAEPPTEQHERHRVERAGDFDVAIGVDRALATREARKRLEGEGL